MRINNVKLVSGAVIILICFAITGCSTIFGSWDEGYMDHGIYILGNKNSNENKEVYTDEASENEKQRLRQEMERQRKIIHDYAHILAEKGNAGTGADSTAYLKDGHVYIGEQIDCVVQVKVYNLEREFERAEGVNVCGDK